MGCPVARRRQVACQHLVFVVDQRHRIFGSDFSRHAKTQQAVDRELTHDGAGKFALVIEWHLQLQRRCAVAAGLFGDQRAGINRLAQFPRQLIGAVGLVNLELLALGAYLAGIRAGRYVGDLYTPPAVDPAHCHQFGVLIDQGFGLQDEAFRIDLFVGDIPANPHELLLPLEQAQAQPLLRVLHIALDGLLLAVNFFNAQVAERRNDGGKKQHHRQQRPQRDEAVLP